MRYFSGVVSTKTLYTVCGIVVVLSVPIQCTLCEVLDWCFQFQIIVHGVMYFSGVVSTNTLYTV